MQEQAEDQDLAGLARHRTVAPRPTASADATVLAPVPAPLDCPYLHIDDDGPSCLALPPAIRLSRRQVEIVCAVAAHVACPRLIKADAGRVPVQVEPPPAIARRRERPPVEDADHGEPAAAVSVAAVTAAATTAASSGPVIAAAADASAAVAGTTALPEPAATTTTPPEPAGAPARPAAPPAATTTPGTTRAAAAGLTPAKREGPGRVAGALTLARVTARTHIVLRPATAAAWLILAAVIVIVIAVLSAWGGLSLPAVASPSAGAAGASPSAASASATTVASPSPTLAPSASPSPSPSLSASPSVAPSPSPSPSVSPSPSTASPFTPEQLAVLTPCPGKPGCYQYRIKSGDNLRNLATFFGVTYPALLAANPQITNPSLIHVGERVTIPIPVPSPTKTPKP